MKTQTTMRRMILKYLLRIILHWIGFWSLVHGQKFCTHTNTHQMQCAKANETKRSERRMTKNWTKEFESEQERERAHAFLFILIGVFSVLLGVACVRAGVVRARKKFVSIC